MPSASARNLASAWLLHPSGLVTFIFLVLFFFLFYLDYFLIFLRRFLCLCVRISLVIFSCYCFIMMNGVPNHIAKFCCRFMIYNSVYFISLLYFEYESKIYIYMLMSSFPGVKSVK